MSEPSYEDLVTALAVLKQQYNELSVAHEGTKARLKEVWEDLQREREHHDACRDALDSATA